ncbi:hypothetical protein RUM44_008394 [Polyplax serrata]|uniref:Replication protein A OB domain-containing protein n=1 Tax=Polyplax serrata TaxID=468196 RepID=A0ABR1B858_POLSC
MSCGVRKLSIGGLSPDVNNALIIAVLIAKQNYKTFISKKVGEEKGVWNFTLRDSPVDTINVTVWGSSDFIQNMYHVFNTGDVVEILNPRISFKQPGALDAVFCPAVTSPFQLHLQENRSNMLLYAEDDAECFRELLTIPTKASGDFLRLADVFSYGQAMKGEYVNLLVAVKSVCEVSEIRNIRSKRDAKELICRHITVMDQSHLEFHITLWNEEIIQRSDSWRPRGTIIFFADVRLEWDNYRSAATANITARTVVTENPKTKEAIALRNYAKTAPIQPTAVLEYFAQNFVDANTINTVMTTAQILDKAYSRSSMSHFTALLYVCITHMDLDGSETVTTFKCSKCSQVLDDGRTCINSECFTRGKRDLDNPLVTFNLRINLTDHRGTLFNCRLTSPVADEIFGCSAEQYVRMSSQEKTRLKWNLLLARCEARVLVLTTSPERPQPLVSLVACKLSKISSVASKLPFY